jgi:predicted nucleic acid-binding Zn ribbon protein
MSDNEVMNIERKKRQNARNLALFFALLAFVVLVYAVTIIKMKLGYGL